MSALELRCAQNLWRQTFFKVCANGLIHCTEYTLSHHATTPPKVDPLFWLPALTLHYTAFEGKSTVLMSILTVRYRTSNNSLTVLSVHSHVTLHNLRKQTHWSDFPPSHYATVLLKTHPLFCLSSLTLRYRIFEDKPTVLTVHSDIMQQYLWKQSNFLSIHPKHYDTVPLKTNPLFKVFSR